MRSPKPLDWAARLANLVCQRPRAIIAVALLLAVAAVTVAVNRLEFRPDRNELIAADLDFNQRFQTWLRHFPEMTDFVIVVDHAGDLEAGKAFIRDLRPRLLELDSVKSARFGYDPRENSAKLARLLPDDEFEAAIAAAPRLADIAEAPSLAAALQAQIDRALQPTTTPDSAAATQRPFPDSIEPFARLIDALHALATRPAITQNLAEELLAQGFALTPQQWQPLTSPNGELLIINIRPALNERNLNAPQQALADIREQIGSTLAHHPGIDAGVTGIDALEADETDIAIIDSTMASIFAGFFIGVLMILSFGGWRVPVLAAAAMLIAVAWSFGFLTLAIGHLQVLSVVFVVILLGLGVDFAIHLASVMEKLPNSTTLDRAWAQVFRRTGPGVLVGAVTTSAAFAVTTLTDFKGVAEMGLIASAGVLLCLVAMYTVFPAIITVFAPDRRLWVDHGLDVFRPNWLLPIARHPRRSLAAAAIVVVAGLAIATQIRFSNDLVALHPDGTPSAVWQERLSTEGDVSIWYAVSIAESLQQARQRADDFRQLPTVARVSGIARALPPNEDQRIERIERARAELAGSRPEAPPPAQTPLENVLTTLASLAGSAAFGIDASNARALEALAERAAETAQAVAVATPARAGIIERAFASTQLRAQQRLNQLLDDAPITQDDIPDELLAPFRSENGRFALEIEPRLPPGIQSPLDPEFLPAFVDDITAIDPDATGVLTQIHYSGLLIRDSFIKAGLLALAVVFAIVIAATRSPTRAALSLVPVCAGFILTFAVMVLTGRPIDLANIIVLPLMFGIGVDVGVHILHRASQNPYERPIGLTRGTGKAVVLTTLTTALGFASMMLAAHRGIAGLGFVVALGVILTLLAAITILPAAAELRSPSKRTHARR